MTFGEWFKKNYPANESAYFVSEMRKAWNAAANECLKAIQKAKP